VEQRTKGIVFQAIKYKDNQIIAKIFTERYGLKAFMVRSGKSAKTSVIPLLQPLTIVELTTQAKENSSLLQLKQLRLATPFSDIPFNPIKSSIVLFLDEILTKTIAEDYQNDDLFTFLEYALLLLDQSNDIKNFHLWFLMELSRHYGFYPSIEDSTAAYFDFNTGESQDFKPSHPNYIEGKAKELWFKLVDQKFEEISQIPLTGEDRRKMLEHLVKYIQLHLENLREIKSLEVLRELFS
jgi:DNA repair protein RecO (recombination protein O)